MKARDEHFMRLALTLGARGLGRVWPNPAVGCVVVRDGVVVGRGWTRPGGRPHAEPVALAEAGTAAAGATAYVTLEPCAHHGRTPPCSSALAAAGIRRVVAALIDPDPRVSGRGLEQLRRAGIEVATGCLAAEAERAHAGFLMRTRVGRPLVALKIAQTMDGRIATATGESQWITGEQARRYGHLLRATHDAILVGSGTALADDPELTCRLPGLEDRSPVRVVVDRRLRLSCGSRLVASARRWPLWVLTAPSVPAGRVAALEAQGAVVLPVLADGRDGLAEGLAHLGERGITRLLVEGGASLATDLLRNRLVDRLYLVTAPATIGGDGLAAVAGLGVQRLAEARRWRILEERPLGSDRLALLEPTA
ncbi:bifunctional diaminohydroxyphosphoribosylaminopyrimidine deaminase/5-amino-6-(5-phosphoribosylamino)uracil reductase RibD [Geminicoccaceae bacterium 1502E]|nr:bifunctional diaminohydroxyphosphoribosylaminopyrimidine deaminase/5-amino-6-(5-phosphoribosylamino)uracil reductase RibD [Geminicoccaceae bacterium 1502E]